MKSLVCLVALAACADPATTTPSAPAPQLDVSGGSDQADRDCNVVLRQMLRATDGSGATITDADGWVFVADVTISQDAATAGLVPSMLYQTNDGGWASVSGLVDPTSTGLRFTITIDQDDPGPDTANQALTAIPYLPLPGGGRLFDHNRNSDDLAAYVANPDNDWSIWDAPGTCQAPTDSRGATLTFAPDFTVEQTGVLVPGGTVTIVYDASRAPTCRGAGWDVTANLLFDGSGELLATSVANATATFTIPTDGARGIEVWFVNTDATGCTSYDSNEGANYQFAIETPPQWLGLAGNLITRDDSSHCDGAADAVTGFTYDTWAREQATITNLCFQVYQPGETDVPDPDLWKQLDAELHWRVVNPTAASDWTITPVGYDAQVGNNAQYAQSWRALDPFRDFHCPELPASPTSDGMYVQLQVEYYVTVNGAELQAQAGSNYVGTFIDYPTNAWRTANCP